MSKFAFRLLPNSKICCLSPSKSAFLCGGVFLGVCLFFNGLMLISVRTASWSLTPGMTLQTLTMFFVMTRSRVLFPLVGVATSLIRLKTSNRSTNW